MKRKQFLLLLALLMTASAGTWTVTFGQTTELTATFAEKTYTVSMAENTADAAKWQGSLDGGQSYADLPIVSVKNNPVTLKYNGRLKVKSVTATHDGENVDETTVKITTSDISEGDASVVFNVQLSNAPLGEAIVQVQVGNTIHNVIFSAGILTETLTLDNPHTSSVTAEIVGVTGGFFEKIVIDGQKATAYLE